MGEINRPKRGVSAAMSLLGVELAVFIAFFSYNPKAFCRKRFNYSDSDPTNSQPFYLITNTKKQRGFETIQGWLRILNAAGPWLA